MKLECSVEELKQLSKTFEIKKETAFVRLDSKEIVKQLESHD